MDPSHKYRLRVEICIGTIIDVHKSVKEAVDNMDMSQVSEGDVLMVEQATNALLGEFRSIYETGDYGPLYERVKH